MSTKKPQATPIEETEKTPIPKKLGRGTTGMTVGLLYGIGRGAYHFGKNFGEGAVEKIGEIREGYNEAKAEAEAE
jgi:hypothetical protein